jgi:hypothetical protein
MIRGICGLSLIKDGLKNLGRKYTVAASGRSELMKIAVSEYNAAKPTIQKNKGLIFFVFSYRKPRVFISHILDT